MNDQDWDKYRGYVKDSIPTVWRVVQYLLSRGHTVQVPPTHIAANQNDRLKMADNGDFFLIQRCEVKQTRQVFTGPDDWPFPVVMICNKNSFDRAKGSKPAYYIIPSSDFKCMIVIDVAKTEKSWWAEKRKDSRYDDIEQSFYMIEKTNPDISWETIHGN
jgi:hypothetical protein